MFDFLKRIFNSNSVDFKELIRQGAQIIDVRTETEYANGHIPNSINIPLQKLGSELKKLDSQKPMITCCASGMRSASAKGILKQNGFETYNGGAWIALQKKLKS